MKKLFTLLAAGGLAASSSFGQLLINTTNTPTVITFEGGSPGVTGTGSYNGSGISSSVNRTLASGVWAARVSTDASFNWNPLAATGNSTTNYDFFRTDQPGLGNLRRANQTPTSGTSGLGNATISGSSLVSFKTGNIVKDYLYIAVQNHTGSTVSSWSIDYDAFRTNQTSGIATSTFVYATVSSSNFFVDGTAPTFSSLAALSFATLGTGTGGGNWEALSFSPQNVTASVANNDYFIFGWQISQSGNNSETLAFDNITISAIPEPTTWALLAAGLTTLVVFRRRRRD